MSDLEIARDSRLRNYRLELFVAERIHLDLCFLADSYIIDFCLVNIYFDIDNVSCRLWCINGVDDRLATANSTYAR